MRRHEFHAKGAPVQDVAPVQDRLDHTDKGWLERESVLGRKRRLFINLILSLINKFIIELATNGKLS